MKAEKTDAVVEEKMREAVSFFNALEFPEGAIKLNEHEVILDAPKFVKSHLSTLRANWKNISIRAPYLARFLAFYDLMKSGDCELVEVKKTVRLVADKPAPKPIKKPAKRKT